jgi:DnaJ-class molecular chaperone
MKEGSRQAEDVAAVLRGMVKCPNCRGEGTTWRLSSQIDPDAERVDEECWVCDGRRWITEEDRKSLLAAYDDNDKWLEAEEASYQEDYPDDDQH